MSSNSFVDPFSPTITNADTTSRRSSSTVRSRPRRMVSFTDDDDLSPQPSAHSTTTFSPALTPRSRGATPSPFASRGVSPLPMRHPSRATESLGRHNSDITSSGGLRVDRTRGKSTQSRPTDLLDASWSSLQSLASSVLGSDTRPAANGSARSHIRKPSRPDYIRSTPRSSPAAWGPSGSSMPEIGTGTKEERHALVQAKKREVLLLADTDPATGRRHKRRDSCDQTGHSGIDPERDEGALAYVHQVQATDTITGVTIKYGCQPAVIRKANGFWPSDSIQSRRTVLLPVDSCSVKGRPIQKNVDLLGEDPPDDSTEDPNGSSIAPTPDHGTPTPEEQQPAEAEGDRIWKHESWVQIDGFAEPVEIGRVPRRALGFFPRTRRKSASYTTDTESVTSEGRTPAQSSFTAPSEYNPSPRSSPALSGRSRHQRQRSGIQLSGPGVGTLDRQSMAPGPALDGLSKFFAQHLPNLAPQSPPPSFESTSTTAPSNPPTGLDNIGGALEGWVRKMTTKAKASLNELQSPPSGGPTRRMGDLIELNDSTERNLPVPRAEFSRSTSSLQEARSLRERFPSPLGIPTSRTRSGDRVKDD